MGRRKVKFPSKTDRHCKKNDEENWGESVDVPNNKSDRQNIKRNLRNISIDDFNDDD